MKVLVLEAEETTRNLMGVMLSRLGYKATLTQIARMDSYLL